MSFAACEERWRKAADLGRHDGEAAARVAGARRLDGRVERQQVGLPGDLVDDPDDVGYFARRFFDLATSR